MALTKVNGQMLDGAITADSSGNIGIGTASPNNVMTTYRGAGVNNYIQFTNATTGTASTDGCLIGVSADDTALRLRVLEAAPMIFTTSDTERMRIDSSGRVTTPSQPAFRVGRLSGVSVADQGVVVFDSATTNIGSNYNTSNGRFTAPVAGMYQFNMQVLFESLSNGNQCEMQFRVNGSDNMAFGPRVKYQADYTGWSGYVSMIGTTSVYLNANDYVQVFNISGGTRSVYGSNPAVWSVFSGFLIG